MKETNTYPLRLPRSLERGSGTAAQAVERASTSSSLQPWPRRFLRSKRPDSFRIGKIERISKLLTRIMKRRGGKLPREGDEMPG